MQIGKGCIQRGKIENPRGIFVFFLVSKAPRLEISMLASAYSSREVLTFGHSPLLLANIIKYSIFGIKILYLPYFYLNKLLIE